jgi:DNA polymerase-3 subunit epsilon
LGDGSGRLLSLPFSKMIGMVHRPLVFLDIETTGGSAQYARITEIGALRVENYQVVGTFKQLLNPKQHVPAFITQLTGITDEMLWDAPTFQGIANDLELFLSDAIFIAHNVNFDYSFIKMEFERLRYNFYMDRLCTAKLSRKLYPEHASHRLDKIIERMNLKVAHRHRAFDDAEVLWKFFQSEYSRDALQLHATMNKIITTSKPRASKHL